MDDLFVVDGVVCRVVGCSQIFHLHTWLFPTFTYASYFYTFLFPSAALMPMEYCLPLMDVADIVQDLDFVVTYRQFILDRTGVALIIET